MKTIPIALCCVLLAACITPQTTGIQDHGDTGVVQLRGTKGLGALEMTPETRPTWDKAAQAECDKNWPGTKAHFEQWRKADRGLGGVVATYVCR